MGDRKTIVGGASVPMTAFVAAPEIQWNHIDGPLMTWAGNMHWLTFGERFFLFFGLTTHEKIAHKRFGRPLSTVGWL